jgi:hypothetical protein
LNTDRLSEIISRLTPERLQEVILGLADSQPPENRSGVSLETILGALVTKGDLGEGRGRSKGYQRLKQAIQDGVAQIPGIKYVHSRD